ncbi:MAG TPA: hypothetical protein PK339_10355 [Flavitalea sp.]|nr:hypothetical protein [Flavitalea sp.]
MSNGSKNKAFIAIIAILLLTNIILLISTFRVKKGPPPGPPKSETFTEKIKKQVQFDTLQLAAFEERRKNHWPEMRVMLNELTSAKESFYSLIYDSTVSDSVLQARAADIGARQQQIDLKMIGYFKDVRKLCKPEQFDKYDSLIPPIIKRIIARK